MIGIIGFGRFGQLMARYLAKDFEVFVYNRRGKEELITDVITSYSIHYTKLYDIAEDSMKKIDIFNHLFPKFFSTK